MKILQATWNISRFWPDHGTYYPSQQDWLVHVDTSAWINMVQPFVSYFVALGEALGLNWG